MSFADLECPHCNKENEYELWESLTDDGDCTEVECRDCEKEFEVSLTITCDYTVCDLPESKE